MGPTMPHASLPVLDVSPELRERLAQELASLLPLPPEERLDGLLRDQRERWERGQLLAVEVYRAAAPELIDGPEVLLCLISGEMRLRGMSGAFLDPREYQSRFPGLEETLARQAEVETALQSSSQDEPLSSLATQGFYSFEGPALKVESIPGYEVLEELGRGGMGVVYKARDVHLGRVVALKMILPEKGQTQDARERFKREAAHIAQLKHPNIVPVFAFGEHEGKSYFALELISGGSLQQLMRKEGAKPWAPEKAARFVATLAGALAYAHGKGIIHRDLKPANILLNDHGEPHVTDFGLARQLEAPSHTIDGAVVGTPAYMSPEQATGRTSEVGPPADVFGLGAVLFQLLTGRPPYQGVDVQTTLRQAEVGKVAPVREVNPGIPRALARIVDRALATNPSERFQTAEALRQALEGWLASGRRWALMAAAAAFVLLAAGLSWAALSGTWPLPGPGPIAGKDGGKSGAGEGDKEDHSKGAQGKEPDGPLPPLDFTLFQLTANSKTNEARKGLVVGRPGTLPVREGEQVQLHADLTRPAYLYILWIDATGAIDHFYPWDRRDPRALEKPAPTIKPTAQVRMPPDEDKGFPMEGESGLETIILMARETPLPSDVRLDHELGPIKPAPLRNPNEYSIRTINRVDPRALPPEKMREGLFEPSRGMLALERDLKSEHRGPKKEAEELDEPVVKLMRKMSKHFDLVLTIRFAYKQ
jgi:predicted Ser/Thr protein kinase